MAITITYVSHSTSSVSMGRSCANAVSTHDVAYSTGCPTSCFSRKRASVGSWYLLF